jgi:hypothetical protein
MNQTIAHIFSEMADLLELSKENPFRIRAFRRAARTIETLPEEAVQLDEKQLLEIPGIGKGLADHILEFKRTGHISDHLKLRKKFPDGLLQIMNYPGLGAKRAGVLYKELKIDSIEKLQKAAKAGKIRLLEGFGEKMEANILSNMELAQSANTRTLITPARQLGESIVAHIEKAPYIKNTGDCSVALSDVLAPMVIKTKYRSKVPMRCDPHVLRCRNGVKASSSASVDAMSKDQPPIERKLARAPMNFPNAIDTSPTKKPMTKTRNIFKGDVSEKDF